jgi:serine protease AprX
MKLRKAALLLVVVAVIVGVMPARTPVHAQHRPALSRDLLNFQASRSPSATRVILHGDPAAAEALSVRHHVRVVRRLDHEIVVEATPAQLDELTADSASPDLSGDLPVADFMSVSNKSLAADQTRAGKSGGLLGLGSIPGVTGQGIVVAVLDSGIAAHKALAGRVIANVSMIAGDTSDDVFGHGTHVAGIITGSGSAAAGVTSEYTGGIAPGAQLVNVKVLGDDGVGMTSDVIAGIDWVIANKALYHIRIINLSLGHVVTEPSLTDPLCQAVERAYEAGLIVVAAAGNAGKLADGTPVLGGIASPGNSPFALTVGTINTWGTVSRADDTVATYSSRGPTRYDMAVKPDLAAPGNKIISLEATNSYLAAAYPTEHIAGTGNNAYYRMSGTSMSTPMVSGGAALLLQASPGLTPAQVKFLLQSGSTYMTDGGLMAAGAGSANFWSSRQTEASGGLSLVTSLVGGLLDHPGGASFWDSGTMSERMYAGTGIHLLNLLQLPFILLNPGQLTAGNLNLVGLTNPINLLGPNRILWGDVSYWTSSDHVVWGDDITSPEGQHVVWGDNDTTDDYHVVWGDSMISSDAH